MMKHRSVIREFSILATATALAFALSGCSSGSDGGQGAPGPVGPGVASVATATGLVIDITSVTIASPPVVEFTVENQDGVAVSGFSDSDLRFNIAKLVPGSNGAPSNWQNYINSSRNSGAAVGGSQERASTGGTLVDHKNGTFTYTFATDITDPAANPCPGPCTDADGNDLDISYQPNLVHRVTIQQGNSAYPRYNAIYDFIPAGGSVTNAREIVKTETCNECHNQLRLHGSRVEIKLCVTCHNPGTWSAGTPNQTADFKVMIHKIHRGEHLPSVEDGTPYSIGGHDYSTVIFPYSAVDLGDTRACAKCHDGAVTAQGNNWKTQFSKAACGSCHDDVYFGASPDPNKPYETVSHTTLSGITDPEDGMCSDCHGVGESEDVVVAHDLPNQLKAEGAKYQFNVVSVANTVAGGSTDLQVTFSVTNPAITPVTYPASYYDIKTHPAFACVPGTGVTGSLSVLVGWDNVDENNSGSGNNPGQPYTSSVLDTYSASVCTPKTTVVDNGDGTFTATITGKRIPSGVTGSGRAALYGRVRLPGTTENARIRAGYKDFGITDSPAVARRTVVDIAKCEKCHDQVSLHGESRTNEPGLCVICHNPSATDVNRRPKGAGTGGLFPDASVTRDGKAEEAIDFKRMIHGIHAAAATDYDGVEAHGFRTKGLVVYGFSAPVDFSHVRFPGLLNDCLTCHLPGTYELNGDWEVPTISGILGSTISTVPNLSGTYSTQLADQTDDLNITPTAGVCSACHDGQVAKSHMELNGALFAALQSTIDGGATLEACAICHGPGRVADVKVMHGVK